MHATRSSAPVTAPFPRDLDMDEFVFGGSRQRAGMDELVSGGGPQGTGMDALVLGGQPQRSNMGDSKSRA